MPSRNLLLFSVLATALVLRCAAAVSVHVYLERTNRGPFLIAGDASGYWELAQRIARGEEYAVHDPPRRVMRMPGFPILLAAVIRLCGPENLLAARIALSVVGTVACGLVYLLGRELYGERIGLAAAALIAVSPTMIVFSVVILSETTFAACLLLNLLAIERLVREPADATGIRTRAGRALLVGLTAALATHVRPSWLLVGPVFAVGRFLAARGFRRVALLEGALVVVAMAVLLAPWAIRNRRVTGHWVVTTLWVGPSLYDGLNPQADGSSNMTFYDRDNLMVREGLSEYEVDRHYRRLAWQFVRTHPWQTLRLGLIKLWRFWKPWPSAAQFSQWWQRAVVAAWFLPILLLACVGLLRFPSSLWRVGLLLGPILYLSLVHVVFVGSLRYRLPAEYPLCVLSAVGLVGRSRTNPS